MQCASTVAQERWLSPVEGVRLEIGSPAKSGTVSSNLTLSVVLPIPKNHLTRKGDDFSEHTGKGQRTLAKLLRSQSIVDRKRTTDSDEATEDVMSKGVPRPPDEATEDVMSKGVPRPLDEATEDVMSKGVPRPPDEAPLEPEYQTFFS